MADAGSPGAGLDPAMLQSILSMVSGGMAGGGLLGGGEQDRRYQPLSGVQGFGPYQGGSFGTLLAGLGPMAQSIGGMGDMAGFMAAPGLMSRLMNPGADPMMLARQRMMQAEMAKFQFNNGSEVARGLGFDPNSDNKLKAGIGQAITGASPFLMAMSPEFASLAAAVTPNVLTSTGIRDLMTASMITDPMGRFRSQDVDALRAAQQRLAITDKGLTNSRFTAGANQTEFAGMIEYAADMGMADIDMDRNKRREERRRELAHDKYKKKFEDLGEKEQDELTGMAQLDVEKEALVRGGSYAARISRSVRNTYGVGFDESKVLMQEMGLSSSSNAETAGIEKLMQNLEALSKASGMTAQNMTNAARALKAQTGGDDLFLQGVVQQAALANKLLERTAGADHVDLNDRMGLVKSNQIMAAQTGAMQAGLAEAMVSIEMYGNDEDRARKSEAYRTGDGKALMEMAMDVRRRRGGLGERAGGFRLTPEEIAAGMRAETVEAAKVGGDINYAFDKAAVNSADYLGTKAVQIFNGLSADTQLQILHHSDGKGHIEDIHGATPEQVREVERFIQRSNDPNSKGRNWAAHQTAILVHDIMKPEIDDEKSRRARATAVQDELQTAGANQGLIPNLNASQIHGVKDVAVALGWLVPDEMDKLLHEFSDKDQTSIVAAARARANAMAALKINKDDEGAQKKLTEAVNRLSDFGLTEADPKAAPAKKDGAPDKKGAASDAPADTKDEPDQAAPKGPTGKTTKRADGQAKGMEPKDKGSLRDTAKSGEGSSEAVAKLEIDLKINGQRLEVSNFTAKGAMPKGYRGSVNGQAVGGEA